MSRFSLLISSFSFLVLILTAGVAVAQPAPPVPLPEYRDALYRALAYVEHAQTAPSKEDRARDVGQAIAVVEAVSEVTLPDGTTQAVDNSHILNELHKQVPDLKRAASLLRVLIAEVDRTLQAQTVDVPGAEESLARVLRDPEFHRAQTALAPTSSIVQQIVDWLDSLLSRPVATGMDLLTRWALPLAGAVLVVVVLLLFARGLWRSLAPEASVGEGPAEDEAHLDARTAHARALERARAGDRRAAIRYLYLSALLRLDERRLLRYDRSLTNREYVRSVRDHAALRRLLSPVVSTFDRAWYGRQSLTDEDFQTYERQVEEVCAMEPGPEARR